MHAAARLRKDAKCQVRAFVTCQRASSKGAPSGGIVSMGPVSGVCHAGEPEKAGHADQSEDAKAGKVSLRAKDASAVQMPRLPSYLRPHALAPRPCLQRHDPLM